jgi:hypothetical protein
MKNSKVLEMLKQNRIEELIADLQDEIFTESLTVKPNAKKRYTAMKRYLKTISEARPILTKPCAIEFDGTEYNAFTNGFSLALTTESCGEIEMCSEPERYPDVCRLIPSGGEEGKIDFNRVLADAKSKGYKYTKNAIHSNDYLMCYKGAYFRIALVDITYGILDDGQEMSVRFNGEHRPLTIKNDIGMGIIMPVRYYLDEPDHIAIIDVEE